MSKNVPTVNVVYVKTEEVYCPHCEHANGDWLSDPRVKGNEQECDECGGKYTVASNAELVMAF